LIIRLLRATPLVSSVEEAAVERLIERCAGLDVHKASVTATVRVPGDQGGRRTETRTFRATTAGLVLLGDWLASVSVTVVGMESTGVYWKPVVRHEAPCVRAEVKGLRLRPAAGR
jgi:transposase